MVTNLSVLHAMPCNTSLESHGEFGQGVVWLMLLGIVSWTDVWYFSWALLVAQVFGRIIEKQEVTVVNTLVVSDVRWML